jgi:ADP-heptose:LPS heptosyltransferase
VVTRGSPVHVNDAQRSLPPAFASRLLRLGRSLEPEATGFRNFRQTAELVAGLDLVITVDSAVAHLAGAMHKPVWVLLPAHNTDWRWLKDRSDSPWYPTMRLFRQPRPDDWESVFSELESAVRAEGLQVRR